MADSKKRAGMIANLPRRTGRTLEEWVRLVRAEGPDSDTERRTWLKEKHGVGHFQARLVVEEARRLGVDPLQPR